MYTFCLLNGENHDQPVTTAKLVIIVLSIPVSCRVVFWSAETVQNNGWTIDNFW